MRIRHLLAACLAAASACAWGHAHLESAQPAVDSKAAEVQEVRLRFSEAIEVKLSSIRIETDEERAVVTQDAQADPGDPKVLYVHCYEKLPVGRYRVKWSVVAADGHHMSGIYSFIAAR